MRYEHDRKASEEILRLLIQKMAGHPASFTPQSYAVWHDYTTGINPALSQTIDNLLDKDVKLNDDTIEMLFLKYVSECNMDVEWALREDIQQLLRKLAQSTEETDGHVHQFSNKLQVYADQINSCQEPPKLVALISGMAGDTNKMIDSMQALQSELAASKQKVEKLHKELQLARGEAMIDPLTGILNRRGFENSAKLTFSNQMTLGKNLCLLIVDIDHFKKINDTYGHLFGDKVIRAIAATLKSKVRGQDSVARLGGEEFALLLAETDISGARIVAEHIRQTIEECKIHRHDTQEKVGGITISIGVAECVSEESLVDLMDHADKALYVSKGQGRNKTTVYGQY